MLGIYHSDEGPVYRCESCSTVLGAATEDLRRLLLLKGAKTVFATAGNP
jgi:hypothetical protein